MLQVKILFVGSCSYSCTLILTLLTQRL